jgi:hypothetical protein
LPWHWAALVQLVPQLVPLHRKPGQVRVAPAVQLPAPLQVLAAVSVDPLQLAAPQPVPLGWTLHAPRPSQPPERPQVLAACAGHSPPGSMPSGIEVQVPPEPPRLHAWQVPPQAVAQQTLSTQVLLAHWPAAVQAMPFGRLLRQVPPSQKNPD